MLSSELIWIREKGGFQLRPEYGTNPSIYYINGKIGLAEEDQSDDEDEREALLVGAER